MDLLTQLETAFNTLRAGKIVKTQKEFGELIGYSAPAISNAFKGNPRYLTENMVAKAERAVAQHTGTHPAAAEQDIVIPAPTRRNPAASPPLPVPAAATPSAPPHPYPPAQRAKGGQGLRVPPAASPRTCQGCAAPLSSPVWLGLHPLRISWWVANGSAACALCVT